MRIKNVCKTDESEFFFNSKQQKKTFRKKFIKINSEERRRVGKRNNFNISNFHNFAVVKSR